MKCELVKKVKVEGEGENRKRFVNYYLVFENDVLIPVVCKYYTTKSTDKKDVEKINALNTRNATKLDTLATIVKED